MSESDKPTLEQRIRQRAYELWEAAGRPEGHHDAHWAQAARELGGAERSVDTQLEDTFPASDPPARTGVTGP